MVCVPGVAFNRPAIGSAGAKASNDLRVAGNHLRTKDFLTAFGKDAVVHQFGHERNRSKIKITCVPDGVVVFVVCYNTRASGSTPWNAGKCFVAGWERAVLPQWCVGVFGKVDTAGIANKVLVQFVKRADERNTSHTVARIARNFELTSHLHGNHQSLQFVQHLYGLYKLQRQP